ncbi:DUF1697 domain-containing protein [Paenibacillus sp. J22TS3]|uniref:DUF1697 domain-containing protein n=1 Tax=Paenibacillus sp. J22TS3 TaxID=2807192 RepID=UPI001B13C04D|nr:DUF1697 domain-containing protein [Paenibacillus sp. J22TS3]GIP23875.1 hypothetical protein J22TS3_41500 [Paenibacillus sp. J22TS3]
MIYIALLRGINVGGNNKIKMADLKKALEDAGFLRVKTYIQSGNVLFESDKTEAELVPELEGIIHTAFGISLKVILRTADELDHLITNTPYAGHTLAEGESFYVTLLGEPLPQEELVKLKEMENEGEQCSVSGRDVYYLFRKSILDSKLAGAMNKIKIPSTTRNWNTMNKLNALAIEMSQQ